jgi:hypothetical protein
VKVVTPTRLVTYAARSCPQNAGWAAPSPGKINTMKNNPHPMSRTQVYSNLLAEAEKQSGLKSPVVISISDADDEVIVRLPRAVHPLCWASTEHIDDESSEALVLALRARYHPDLSMSLLAPLFHDIDAAMLRTADEAGLLLVITEGGFLSTSSDDYDLFFVNSAWAISLPDTEVIAQTLADAVRLTTMLRRTENRRKHRSR